MTKQNAEHAPALYLVAHQAACECGWKVEATSDRYEELESRVDTHEEHEGHVAPIVDVTSTKADERSFCRAGRNVTFRYNAREGRLAPSPARKKRYAVAILDEDRYLDVYVVSAFSMDNAIEKVEDSGGSFNEIFPLGDAAEIAKLLARMTGNDRTDF